MKKKGISYYKNKLDKVFSEYIRLKETWLTSGGRMGRCVTCGRTVSYEQLDAGHFIGRGWLRWRYSEENVHVQCRHCNRFQDGRKDDYFLWMIEKYGQEKVEKMIMEKYNLVKLTEDWYREKIKEYQRKVKELKEKC